MSSQLKIAAIAGLALAVGIGIGPLLRGDPYGAVEPSPSPIPSPTATPMPLPYSYSPLKAGTYALGQFPDSPIGRMTATVPDGWHGIKGTTFANLFQDSDDAMAGGIFLSLPDNFYNDPCNTNAGLWDPPLGPTVNDFVNAMVKVPGYQTTDPVDADLFGFHGKYLEETGPASVATCTDGFSHAWQTKYNETAEYLMDGQHDRLWVLDVDGVRLLVSVADSVAVPHSPGTDPVDMAQTQAVLDSIRIAPAPTPAGSPAGSPAP